MTGATTRARGTLSRSRYMPVLLRLWFLLAASSPVEIVTSFGLLSCWDTKGCCVLGKRSNSRTLPPEALLLSTGKDDVRQSISLLPNNLVKTSDDTDSKLKLGRHRLLAPLLCCLAILVPTPQPAAAVTVPATYQEWTLGNGKVQLPLPLTIGNLNLVDPVLLGSGGGGAVFAMTPATGGGAGGGTNTQQQQKQQQQQQPPRVALKVSWESSASSVQNECHILQTLEANRVSGVEQCLASAPYPAAATTDSSNSHRIMIVMQPVLDLDNKSDHLVNSIGEIPTPQIQRKATKQVVQTLVQMLAANVATTDVQPLISANTGQVLFIDLTEARSLASPTPTFLDLALCGSFVSEMMALIPNSMHDLAGQVFETELLAIALSSSSSSSSSDKSMPQSVQELLLDSVPFLTPATVNALLQGPTTSS